MHTLHPATFGILASILLSGCAVAVTKAPQPFPGFNVSTSDCTAVLRESRHVFVAAVDGKVFDRKGVTLGLLWDTYRQYQVPAGTRQVSLIYMASSDPSLVNFWNGNPGPMVTLNVELKPGRKYSFTPDVNRYHLSLGHYVMYDFWQPAVFDDTTKETVAVATQRTRVE